MVKNYSKKDLRTRSDNNYDEYIFTRGVDVEFTEGLETLWQTIVGELKTEYGEVGCERLSTYGSYLYKLKGQKRTPSLVKELNFFIDQVMQTYPQVTNWEVQMMDNNESELNFMLIVYAKDEKYSGVVSIV